MCSQEIYTPVKQLLFIQDAGPCSDYCSIAVCIGNDTMISLDIVHIYGALFIDLAKVSDTVDRTFLLQQFKHDTDFIVAWFSSNIIGHWVLWGSWHCNSSAVSVEQRKDIPFPQRVRLAPSPSPFTPHSLHESTEKSVTNTQLTSSVEPVHIWQPGQVKRQQF